MNEEPQLLKAFVERRSEAAFQPLIDRYGGLVYGTAFRYTGNAQLAEEVAQDVFVTLARKAHQISESRLGGWLHRTAINKARNANQKETNRRNAMKCYADNLPSAPESAAGSDAWQNAISHLDEAIDRLGHKDRDALILRFFEGRTYREMGQMMGKSEEASRKQTARILEKLGRFLGRRGGVVPAVVIASGLSAELSKSAPHCINGSAALAAAQATSSSSIGIFLNTLTIMNAKTAVIAAALILTLCLTGGFVSGYIERPSAKGGWNPDEDHSGGPVGENVPKALRSARPDTDGLAALLRAIEQDLSDARWDSSAHYRADLRLRAIPAPQLEEALVSVGQMPGGWEQHAALARSLLGKLAESNALRAIDLAEANLTDNPDQLDRSLRTILTKWATNDPAKAWEWLAVHRHDDEWPRPDRRTLTKTLFRSWALRDPEAALKAIEALPSGENIDESAMDTALYGITSAGNDPGVRSVFQPFIESLPMDHRSKPEVAAHLIGAWSFDDPPAASDWLQELELSPLGRQRVESSLLFRWIENDPSAAADWYLSDGTGSHADRLAAIVRLWSVRDPHGAGQWLAQQPLDAQSDDAVAAFATGIVSVDPESAIGWAESLHSPNLRRQTLQSLLETWKTIDADAAARFLESDSPSDWVREAANIPPNDE